MTNPPTIRSAVTTGATHGTIVGVLIFVAVLAANWLAAPTVAPKVEVVPVVVPAATPESWIVLDAQGVRVTDPAIEKIAGSLKAGRWTAQGIPKPGEKGISLSIVVDDGVKPLPPEPPKPDPPKPDPPKPPVVDPTTKATAATYVYEKDSGGVPAAVMSGLNKVNRESKYTITAGVCEDDPDDGTGDVPEQFKLPLKAAREAGLPALVVTAGDVVLKIVKAPKTEAEVTEAVQ
jgi:hypothetical protein